jgi:DNA-binding protein
MADDYADKILWVKPQELPPRVNLLTEKIVSRMMQQQDLNIVGIREAIFFTCMASNMATDISGWHVNELIPDYLEVPIMGNLETIFIRLGKKSEINIEPDQLVRVGHDVRMEALVTLCLFKMMRSDRLKIIAAGSAINEAVDLSLRLTKGLVSNVPIAISFMRLQTIKIPPNEKNTSGVSIYLKKGCKTNYSKGHQDLLKEIRKTPTGA